MDVIILDIGLPKIDGYAVAEAIRKMPHGRKVTLIAFTGYGMETDQKRSREAGFDHHLVKPTDFEKVAEILATIRHAT